MCLLAIACAGTVSCRRTDEKVETTPAQSLALIEKLFVGGELEAAEKACIRAETVFSSQVDWSSSFRIEHAKIVLYQGDSRATVSLLAQPMALGLRPELAITRNLYLAIAELRLGHTASSAKALEDAAELRPTGEQAGELLSSKAITALAQSKLDTAELLFRQALVIDTALRSTYQQMEVLMNLGVVALHEQHYEDAMSSFTHARTLASAIQARLAIAKAEGNIGRVYYEIGDFERASRNAELAADRSEKLGASNDQIIWLTNAGLARTAQGEAYAARKLFERALFLSEPLSDKTAQLSVEVALSYLLLRSDPEAASEHIDRVSRLSAAGVDRSDDLEAVLLQALLALHRGEGARAEGALTRLALQADAPSLEWEAENLLAQLCDRLNRPQDADRWYKRSIQTFYRQRLTLKSVELQLPFLENGSDLYMGYMEHLIRAGRTGEALALLDTSRAETLAEGLGTPSAQVGKTSNPQALAGRLGATILVYCLRPERSYLWAITGKEQAFYTLPASGTILSLVARHNEAILGAKDLLGQKDASSLTGRALYDALVAPAAKLLPKGGGRVVLVADSALGRLNFETLIAPGDSAQGKAPRYWIEDVSVTNARSLRLLAAGMQPRRPLVQAEPKMLLIGDPVYAKGEYAPLPNAAFEMAGIAGHFPTAERVIVAQQEALPAAYEASRPGRFRFMHFVAHATASELNPLDSAVILSGKDMSAASGTNKLYASEILKQPLSAELVTLSSCYSSGTRNYTGEGVVGLAWAFLRAGAHSVIGALWEVSDVSTPKLMDTMYTRLLAGDAPDTALRAAKLEMLHTEGVFRKPLYWGAFQLYAGR